MTLRSCIETLRENQKSQDGGGNLKVIILCMNTS